MLEHMDTCVGFCEVSIYCVWGYGGMGVLDIVPLRGAHGGIPHPLVCMYAVCGVTGCPRGCPQTAAIVGRYSVERVSGSHGSMYAGLSVLPTVVWGSRSVVLGESIQ